MVVLEVYVYMKNRCCWVVVFALTTYTEGSYILVPRSNKRRIPEKIISLGSLCLCEALGPYYCARGFLQVTSLEQT